MLENVAITRLRLQAGLPSGPDALLDPSVHSSLLKHLLHRNLHVQAYRVLLESSAAEQGARMAAMDGATRNAGELIKTLTTYFLKTMQAVITK